MDTVTGQPPTAASLALERFDGAAAGYRTACEGAPAAALGYCRPGEGYTLGGTVYHINAVLHHYLGTLEAMLAAGEGLASAPDSSRLLAEADARAGQALTEADRASALAETEDLHQRVRRLVDQADAATWARSVPVSFGPGDPYPTRLTDVLGWLTDHYGEHTNQVSSLLNEWHTLAAVEAFNVAFAAHDVDAVMAHMTEDCVFENSFPPPDGRRLTGATAVAEFWRSFFTSTPSARFTQEETFAAGDRAVARWAFEWDEGPGNRGHVRGVDVFRVREGRVSEKLVYVKG